MTATDVAVICKALGDSNRLRIVQMLTEGEKCGCKLLETFDITQPTLSHHMRILCECGLVNARNEMCHPRGWGTMVRAICAFTKDNQILPLETLIRKITGLPAEIYSVHGKGYQRNGRQICF